jgi:adenine phosphoribosyltransferase
MLDGAAFRSTIDRLAEMVRPHDFQLIAGIEARGFFFAAALAYKLGCGTLMLRKRDKLPGARVGIDYALEYGSDRLEMHADACAAGTRVLLLDDLLATGGTAAAAVTLLRSTGADINLAAFVAELPDLNGAPRLHALDVETRSLMALPIQ